MWKELKYTIINGSLIGILVIIIISFLFYLNIEKIHDFIYDDDISNVDKTEHIETSDKSVDEPNDYSTDYDKTRFKKDDNISQESTKIKNQSINKYFRMDYNTFTVYVDKKYLEKIKLEEQWINGFELILLKYEMNKINKSELLLNLKNEQKKVNDKFLIANYSKMIKFIENTNSKEQIIIFSNKINKETISYLLNKKGG